MAGRSSSASGDASVLLEREAELDQLRTAIAAAAQGRGGAVVVLGPAGIGKTSLLLQTRRQAAAAGLQCLHAHGGELERQFSYGLARQLFETALRELRPSARRAVLDGAAALAAPALGLDRATDGPREDQGFATIHGLYWICVNLAQRGPLVLVIDDLHWADAASLRFLVYLSRRVAELPVLIVMAARPPTEDADAELLARVTADPAVRGIAPAPLSEHAVAELLRTSFGGLAEPAFVQACHASTRGNPFLCTTLIAALRDEGVRPAASEVARVPAVATAATSSLVVRRLGSLAPAAAALARAVAVLGTEVELRHAAVLAELERSGAAAAADALAGQRIVCSGTTLAFTHPMVRAAVHDRIPGAERALLHFRAARLLADEGQPAERIAGHLLAADSAAEAWVVEALRTAARQVALHGDPRTAVSYLSRALREPPAVGARASLLHELGVAELEAGDVAAAVPHLEEASRLAGHVLGRAPVARDLALAFSTRGHYRESVGVLERALDELDGLDHDLSLRLEAELYQSAQMQPELYAAVSPRLDRLDAQLPGTTRGERALLAARATEACLRAEGAARVREWSLRAFEHGLLDDQTGYSSMWGNAAFPLIFADGFAEAARVVAQASDNARRRGSPVASARACTVAAMLHFRQGALHDAESDARTAVELGLQAGFQVSVVALGVLVETLVERGELEAAQAVLLEAGSDAAIAERFLDNWVLHARGWLRLAQGRSADAITDFEELGRRGERGWRPWNPAVFAYRSGLALARLRLGQREAATTLAQEELRLARRWGAARAVGVALRTLGMAQGGQDGLALLRDSVATLAGSNAGLEEARSLLELGAAIRRGGRPVEAREPLHAAMERAHRYGAAPLRERAREELLATGVRPRRAVRSGVEALSPSELRVVRLAAAGMTNRAIAQSLFVTLRTVEVHLTHAYQKLGIESRDQLQAALAAW